MQGLVGLGFQTSEVCGILASWAVFGVGFGQLLYLLWGSR